MAVAIVAALVRGARAAAPRKPVTLGIVFHVARNGDRPVADEAYIDARVARANEIFAAYGVSFVRSGWEELGAQHAALEDAAARDALSSDVSPRRSGVIDCFVVRSLTDVGDPNVHRRGVHWHAKNHPGTHFVILSATYGGVDVLAHELGHFLGNSQHSETPGNLMSYQRDAAPFLDGKQLRKLEVALRGYLGRRELRRVPAPAAVAAQM